MASSVWKGQLTFGLVSVPVRLFRAARKERVRMHYVVPDVPIREKPHEWKPSLVRDLPEPDAEPQDEVPPPPVSRVAQKLQISENGREAARNELLRAHEVAPDRYVTFTNQEIRALRPKTSTQMEIVRSVHLEEIDPVYFATSYYVSPDRGGERPYSLLYRALKDSRLVALATVGMHGREHVVIIRPARKGLLAHTMFYEDEVHQESEYDAGSAEVQPKEVVLARTFVEAIAAPFNAGEFKDSHREKLESLIAQRTGGGEVATGHAATQTPPPVMDIMDALRKSIEAQKKPSAKETKAVVRKKRA